MATTNVNYEVPKHKHGVIIGKAGATIRDLQSRFKYIGWLSKILYYLICFTAFVSRFLLSKIPRTLYPSRFVEDDPNIAPK